MYYLPFSPRTRFCALPDTPANVTSLKEFMAVPRTWEEFLGKYGSQLVTGEDRTGIFFQQNNTFVTNDVGFPQVLFEGPPATLLFVYGHYSAVDSGTSFAYSNLAPGYVRWAVDPNYLEGSPAALESILERLSTLESGRTTQANFNLLARRVSTTETAVARLNLRKDPVDAVLPLISSERNARYQKDADLQAQIDALQVPVSERTLELTNYYSKIEIEQLIADLASEGYVDTLYESAALKVELDALSGRTDAAEGRLDDLSSLVIAYHGLTIINQGTFPLSITPQDLTLVFINGELLPPDAYTLSGSVITLDVVRPAGDRVIVVAG